MTNEEYADARAKVHAAIGDLLDEGELAICWVLTIDVAGPDNTRYLAHRAGGGADGGDYPMAWTALGMLQASADVAKQQLLSTTHDAEDDDEDED